MNRINSANAIAGERLRGPIPSRGFTLVEIMVAMLIGLFLIGGMLQLFVGSKQTYRVVDSLSRIQENTRFALDRIAHDIRLAGHAGCVRLNNLGTAPTISGSAGVVFSNSAFIDGVAALSSASADWPNTRLGTDAIRLRSLSPEYEPLATDMASAGSGVTLEANSANYAQDDILAIADCSNVDVFKAGAVTGSAPAITIAASLSKAYLADSEVMRFHEIVYYIRPSATGTSLALWRNADGNDEELVVGAEDMEILYQVAGSNDYVDASSVSNWGQILGVRVNLLLVSEASNLTQDPQTVTWRANNYPSTPDTRIRQIATTTVALRNRLL